jgi:hypothetical protein
LQEIADLDKQSAGIMENLKLIIDN